MLEYDSVKQAAFQMSVGDRLRLIDDLAATLPDDQPPSLSSEWLEEIGRRSAEIDSAPSQASRGRKFASAFLTNLG